MSSVYAALVLQRLGKEINEENLRRVIETTHTLVDEFEIDALLNLIANHSALSETEIAPDRRIEQMANQIEALNKKLASIEERLAVIEAADIQESFPEDEIELPPKDELTSAEEAAEAESPPGKDNARYVYCLANSGESTSLGAIGVEGNEVYTIPYRDICAVVHTCSAEPYKSDDKELVKDWVRAHQHVVDVAREQFGTILPLGFDTIIRSDENVDAVGSTKNWLKDDYDNLNMKMEKVRGKDEYGVQVFWEPKIIADMITQQNEEVKKIDLEMKSKPKGTAYMYKQKLEKAIKEEMEVKADEYFKDFYNRIKKHTEDVRLDKTKKAEDGKQMLMNLSCLCRKEEYRSLGEELEGIQSMEGVSVRFTGPWPPYSFVG